MDITGSPSSLKLQQQQHQQSLSSSPNSSSTVLLPYWSQYIHDATLLVTSPDLIEDTVLTKLCGGSDNGQFVYLDPDPSRYHQQPFKYHTNSTSRLEPGEIVLEIEGQKISGYTLFDVLSLIKQVCQMQSTVTFKAVRSIMQQNQQQQQPNGYILPLDLRQYLDERFQKGSMDYELQQIIRENVYMRTVPCTTRQPRTGEINGQDYIFLSNEEFLDMENNGELLEYGVYNGHYYGTPKPPKQPFVNLNFTQQLRENSQQRDGSVNSMPQNQNGELNEKSQENNVVNGMNNVGLNMTSHQINNNNNNTNTISSTTSNEASSSSSAPSSSNHHTTHNNGYHNELITENGQTNANNNNNQSNNGSLMSKNNSISNSDGIDIMPYGWEKVEDPEYGVYYVDHINQSTTYDHPNSKNNRMRTFKPAGMSRNSTSTESPGRDSQQPPHPPPIHTQPTESPERVASTRNIFFTQNPEELKGEFIKTSLLKTPHGFGFTIIGANETNDDFLQIKYIVPEGAAARDGKLRQGDVLVYVNNECVLGFTHQNVVEIFQSIPVGQMVDLTVCRGYPLSIDPNDPNIEIMSLAAINNNHNNHLNGQSGAPIASVDELAASINNSLSQSNFNKQSEVNAYDEYYCEEYEELFVNIVKGPKGFGFTIADDAQMNQQKVKQIIDRERCVNLRENDVLLEINGYELKNLGHNQVVELLKECVRGQETSIKLKRRKYQITLPEPPSNSSLNAANNSADGSNNNNMKTLDTNEFNNNNNNTDAHHHYQLNSNNNNNSGVNEDEILINGDLRSTTTINNNTKMPSVKQANFSYHQNNYNPNQMAFNIERRSKTPNILHQSTSIPGSTSRSSANLTSLNHNPYQPQLRSKTPTTDRQLFQHTLPSSQTTNDYIYLNGGNPSNSVYNRNANVDIEHHIPIYDTTAPSVAKPSKMPSNYLPPVNPSMANRSKTPGPEMIYFRNGPAVANEFNNANSNGYMRSKTPTAEMYYPSKAEISPKLVNEMYQMPPYDIDDLLALVLNNDQVSLITDVDGNYYLEMVIDLVRQETGFGFRIVGGEEEGSQVSVGYIVHAGSAHIDGRLRTNDEIIMIDSECVLGATHRRVVQLMTIAGLNRRVKLMIRRKLNYQQYKILLNAQQQQLKSRYMSNMNGGSSITSGVSPVISNANSNTTSGYPYTVTLFRNNNEGFGFVIISTLHKNGPSIADSKKSKKLTTPWIGKIVENSPAERCKRLNVGDRILAVNGTNIIQMNHIDVVKLIKESGNSITLTIGPPSAIDEIDGKSVLPAEYLMSNSVHNINNPMTTTLNRQTSSHYISVASATKAIINQNEYHVIELRKHQSTGFGFSIRGGKEFNIPLYVLKLAEGGPAAMDGRLQVGDQILEINSSDAYSMTHHEAIERIRAGGNIVTLLVRRTGMPPPSITDIIAVNSSVQHQQHPVSNSISATNISNNDATILRAKSPYMNGAAIPNGKHFNSSSTLVNRNY